MNERITRLIADLRDLQVEPMPEEVADALWLAATMRLPRRTDTSRTLVPEQTEERPDVSSPSPDGDPTRSTFSERSDLEMTEKEAAERGRAAQVYLTPAAGSNVPIGTLPFRSPDAPALPGELALARALRPFTRRVSSPRETVLDEAATAGFIAETQIWMPIERPAPERWFDVALIIDASPSMRLWQRVVDELRLLLERTGAFRDVRSWHLDTANPDRVTLTSGPAVTTHPARELIDPSGRRLILLVTDCVAPAWYGVAIPQLLEIWGQLHPVALLHMLPQKLWPRTALDRADLLRVGAHYPGTPNAWLERRPLSRFVPEVAEDGIPIPLLALEPGFLGAWAALVTGMGGPTLPAAVLRPGPMPNGRGPAPEPQVRYAQFRRDATPTAFRLACLLAAAPLRLPVMRLVQRTLLPHARQSHLAEVFLSGLLQRTGPVTADPDEIDYDFLPGVREALLDAGVVPDAVQVQRAVSEYIAENYGRALDFDALLADPAAARQWSAESRLRPFATVTAELLRRLGPRYAEAADHLIESTAFRKKHPRPEKPAVAMTGGDTVPPWSAYQEMARDFYGRQKELAYLREYVGSSAPGTESGGPAGDIAVRSMPLLIRGPGGIGKTALVFKFLHEVGALDGSQRIPFIYIELASVFGTDPAEEEPVNILRIAAQQLGVPFPENTGDALLRGDWTLPLAEFGRLLENAGMTDRPILLVLDGFEEAQYRGQEAVQRLGHFLRDWQEQVPTLRAILVGRASVEEFETRTLELAELDQKAALDFLKAHGFEDEQSARSVIEQFGGHPLMLSQFVDVLRQEAAASGSVRDLDVLSLLSRAGDHGSLSYLLRRLHNHIQNPEVRKLALLGLVLRRITPDLILHVLAEPSGISIGGAEEAEELFGELAREISLVESDDGGGLRHRKDVRRATLTALQAEEPENVNRIHESAVAYYESKDDVKSRAEEIYHRLSLQQDFQTVDDRWQAGVEAHLADSFEEFGARGQAYLAFRLGLEVDDLAVSGQENGVERMRLLGDMYSQHRQYERSIEIYERALETIRKSASKEREDVDREWKVLSSLGDIHLKMGHHSEAEDYFRQAIERTEAELGPESPDADTSRYSLLILYRAQGRIKEAEELLYTIIETRHRVLGPESMQTRRAFQELMEFYGAGEQALGGQDKGNVRFHLSYAYRDAESRAIAEKLTNTLGNLESVAGISRSDDKMPSENTGHPEISSSVAVCDCAIILLSKQAFVSPWFQRETAVLCWRHSMDERFALLPVLLPSIRTADVENAGEPLSLLNEIQMIAVTSGDSVEAVAGEVIGALVPLMRERNFAWSESLEVPQASASSKAIPEKQRLEARITGRVQGVGFRYFAQAEAARLGLDAQVWNEPDGSIRMVAEGERNPLEQLVAMMHHGPTAARVHHVDVKWSVSDDGPNVSASAPTLPLEFIPAEIARALREINDGNGRPVLVANGPPSMLEYLGKKVRDLATGRADVRLGWIDLEATARHGVSDVAEIGRAIALQLGLSIDSMPARSTEQEARWVQFYLDWLAAQQAQTSAESWLVVAGLRHVLSPSILDLINSMAGMVAMRSIPVRLILLGYDPQLPHAKTGIYFASLSPVSKQELIDFFVRAFDRFEIQIDDETVSESVDRVTRSVAAVDSASDPLYMNRLQAAVASEVESFRGSDRPR